MDGVKLTVVGLEELQRTLSDFAPREAKAILRRTTAKIARSLRKDIRKRAPRASGTLRRGIISKRDRGTPNSVEASVRISTDGTANADAWYWHFVEFGTRFRGPRPFITPAVESARRGLRRVFQLEFFDQLARQLRKRAK